MSPRTPIVAGDIAYIPLPGGLVAIIDAGDVSIAAQHNWAVQPRGRTNYAIANKARPQRGTWRLHRLIMQAPAGVDVDHINGDGLDNRRVNLRLATRSENSCNRRAIISKKNEYKGVQYCPHVKRFRAAIKLKGKATHLGYFENEGAAFAAYCEAAKVIHGEFARFE